MSLWCISCRSHVRSPCTSHQQHRARDHRSSLCRRFRSTKGASKARRDHINHEIRNMRALLPITQEDQERLSYLHSMAAICTYIRKSVLIQGLPDGERSQCSLPYEAFLQALHGFILVCTAQGRLVYVSENIADYLGLSMVDVLQGDTVYDMLECPDVDVVKSNLDMDHSSSAERSFICCLQTSKAFKLQHGSCCSMLVRGSFRYFPQQQKSPVGASATTEPLFVALCTPTANRLTHNDCHSFSSSHRLDMTFTGLSDSVFYLLGYPAEEMTGQSWYGLVHPNDLSSSADSHRSLMQADEGSQVQMVLRLQRKDLSWTWMYIRANKDAECQGISCTNFIISETEAKFLEKKISSDASGPPSVANSCQFAQQAAYTPSHNAKCFKRQRTCSSQGEERHVRARRESEQDIHYVACSSSQSDSSPAPLGDSPAFISSPYSPASSCSPLRQEELGHDLLMDVHEGADQPLSSPESTLSYYPYPEAAFPCHQSPSDSLPVATEQTFDQGAFSSLGAHSPLSSSSPTNHFQACTSDARLVPDCLSVSDICESPVECALHPDDFGLLEQPHGGVVVQPHRVPQRQLPVHARLLTAGQSPPPTESNQYSEREQVEISILAQQISSLASSFDMHYSLNPLQHADQPAATHTPDSASDWPRTPSVSSAPKHELLIDRVFDSILKDLDLDTRKSSTSICPGDVSYSHQQGFAACSRFDSLELEQGSPRLTTEELMVSEQLTAGSISIYPLSMQLGHHAQNTGLHQLTHHMQSSLLQDGLAEENLY